MFAVHESADKTPLHEQLLRHLELSSAGAVECIETHISWVLLTDHWAYKLKKPVKFDFLDFSTAPKRRVACEHEVAINRRLAKDVYEGVVAVIKDSQGQLHLVEDGNEMPSGAQIIDWVVKMRRLPADRSLDRMIEEQTVAPQHARQVAAKLSEFYNQLSPVPLKRTEFRDRLEGLIRDNRDGLLEATPSPMALLIKRIHARQLQFLHQAADVFDRRMHRVVEGHGDLRPEHIYLAPEPLIIDGIEFNTQMRQLDLTDELAFLEMECEFLKAPAFVRRIGANCLQAIGDDPPETILAFYKTYRACVRAKVAALRAEQVEVNGRQAAMQEAKDYLSLADDYAARLGEPLLLIVRGLMGTGKSTTAAALAERLGAEHLQTDAIRKEIFGESQPPAEYGAGIYREENRDQVYAAMAARAEHLLAAGLNVIADGTFLKRQQRKKLLALAGRGALCIECRCPAETALQRIADRPKSHVSQARPEMYQQQCAEEEHALPEESIYPLETTGDLAEGVARVMTRLRTGSAK